MKKTLVLSLLFGTNFLLLLLVIKLSASNNHLTTQIALNIKQKETLFEKLDQHRLEYEYLTDSVKVEKDAKKLLNLNFLNQKNQFIIDLKNSDITKPSTK